MSIEVLQDLHTVEEEVMDAYADAAADDVVPAVMTVITGWQLPEPSSEFREIRQRLMTLPAADVYVPAFSENGLREAFDVIVDGVGSADWHVMRTGSSYVMEPQSDQFSPLEDTAEYRESLVHSIAMGCAAALVRALAAAVDADGFLVGELDECMVPNTPVARDAFDRFVTLHEYGCMLERSFVIKVLRETKRILPAGSELPKALAEGFPRRPVG